MDDKLPAKTVKSISLKISAYMIAMVDSTSAE